MELEPIKNDARRARRLRRARSDLVCVICGERELAAFPKRPRVVEGHHAMGEANDRVVVVSLCLTHHALASELQRDLGVELRRLDDRSVLERLEAALRSLAGFFELLAESLIAWANRLRDLVAALDQAQPEWRQLPAARS
jgi:hypothetical protein